MESSKINVNYNKEFTIFGDNKTYTCEFNKKHLDLLWNNNKLWPQHCKNVEEVWPCLIHRGGTSRQHNITTYCR